MEKLTIEQKANIKKLVIEAGHQIKDDLLDTDRLQLDLGLDSIDIIGLVINIESDFEISIDESDYENVKTLEDLYKLIEKYV